jgi:glycosyltransferase involved in cell wall biosynthesis
MIYVSAARIPSEKAHVYQILQMCDAFAGQGVDVELLHPHRVNTPLMRDVQDVKSYYGIENEFSIVELPAIDLLLLTKRALSFQPRMLSIAREAVFWLIHRTYNRSVYRYLQNRTSDIYYLRNWKTLKALTRSCPDRMSRIFFESHRLPRSREERQEEVEALRKIGGVFTITKHLKNTYSQLGVPPERILVEPDGVSLERFVELPDKQAVRQQLSLPKEATIVCYTGHVYPWKGVDTLIRSANCLPEDIHICIVGGRPDDLARVEEIVQREGLPRVQLVGYVPPTQIPLYTAAADVLALPTSGEREIGRHYTSPLKLFEYMAAERPIVASDLPSTREILYDGHNACLVSPDNPQALADGIRWLTTHPIEAEQMAQQARADVDQYTWTKRAKRILDFIKRRLNEERFRG